MKRDLCLQPPLFGPPMHPKRIRELTNSKASVQMCLPETLNTKLLQGAHLSCSWYADDLPGFLHIITQANEESRSKRKRRKKQKKNNLNPDGTPYNGSSCSILLSLQQPFLVVQRIRDTMGVARSHTASEEHIQDSSSIYWTLDHCPMLSLTAMLHQPMWSLPLATPLSTHNYT